MTQVTLKVLPAPETEVSVGIAGLSHELAVRAMSEALKSSAEVSGATYVPQPSAETGAPVSQTVLRLEGIAASVKARAEMLRGLLSTHGEISQLDEQRSKHFWSGIRDAAPLADLREDYVWRLSVPPTRSFQVMADIAKAIDVNYYCDWGGGLIWLAVAPHPEARADVIRSALAPSGGHATLIRAPANVRRSVAVFEPQPQALAELTRRVKLSFDPARVLSRSRMYEGM
jgi:glycolate oxidase FAD binding subunit